MLTIFLPCRRLPPGDAGQTRPNAKSRLFGRRRRFGRRCRRRWFGRRRCRRRWFGRSSGRLGCSRGSSSRSRFGPGSRFSRGSRRRRCRLGGSRRWSRLGRYFAAEHDHDVIVFFIEGARGQLCASWRARVTCAVEGERTILVERNGNAVLAVLGLEVLFSTRLEQRGDGLLVPAVARPPQQAARAVLFVLRRRRAHFLVHVELAFWRGVSLLAPWRARVRMEGQHAPDRRRTGNVLLHVFVIDLAGDCTAPPTLAFQRHQRRRHM